jgi:mTERF domain-containing protein
MDLDYLWLDDPLDDLVFNDAEESDAFLSEEDLSLLYDIKIPTLSQESSSNKESLPADGSSGAPQIISLQDLSRLSSDVSYFYLRDELGLGEDVMWKITNSAGSVLGMKVSNIRNKVDLLRRTLKLSDDETRQLLSSMPGLLQLSANKNLSPTMLFLIRQLDLGTKDLRALVLGCPSLLTYSIQNLQKKLEFFQNTVGCTVGGTRKLLLKEPKLMTSSTQAGLSSRYRFLRNELEIPPDDIRTIVQKNPRILIMSVDNNLQPKLIFFMIMTLMLRPDEVRKILLKFPGILNYNLDNHILPITRYFLSLDISTVEVANMLLKFPRLVTNSLVKIKHVVGYLRFELGLEADGVRRILYQAPQVLSLAPSNLESKVEFLLQVVAPGAIRGDENSTKILRKLIVGMPNLLYLNIENNLEPKVEYLRSRLGSEGLTRALDRLPMLLAYSLEKRIKPRLEMILDAGVDGGSVTVGMPKSEKDFLAWLDARVRKAQKKTSLKKKKAREAVEDKEPTQDIAPKRTEGQQEQDGGRIVHWTRPRRPQ